MKSLLSHVRLNKKVRHLVCCSLVAVSAPFWLLPAFGAAADDDSKHLQALERQFHDALFGGDGEERIVGDYVVMYPGSAHYPAELADTGAQGTVILLLDLSRDGHVKHARVHTSSRSAQLDALAKAKSLTMTYQGNGAPPATASLEVNFRRDTGDSLESKTCADLNVDSAWFRKSFPGRPETDIPAIAVTGNWVRLDYGSRDRAEREPVLDALPFALCSIVSGCAANPTALVKSVFTDAMRTNLEHPERRGALCAFSRPGEPDKLPRSLLYSALDRPVILPERIITPDMSAYPAQLAAAGIQGPVGLMLSLTPDGTITAIKPTNHLFGDALTDAAVAYARSLSFKDAVKPDAPVTTVLITFDFEKDTIATVVNKTCADFNVDVAARTAAVSAATPDTMNAFRLVESVLEGRAAQERDIDRRFAARWKLLPPPGDERKVKLATAQRCANQPDLNFFEAMQQEIASAVRASSGNH